MTYFSRLPLNLLILRGVAFEVKNKKCSREKYTSRRCRSEVTKKKPKIPYGRVCRYENLGKERETETDRETKIIEFKLSLE